MDTLAAKASLTAFLQGKHLRPTRERYLLLEEIMRTNGHFDAESLYASLSRRGLKASRATVYNTLELFVRSGLISRYRFGEKHSRYEKMFGRPRHDHLICLECGEIVEFVSPRLARVERDVCAENGFTLEHATYQIFGTCAACRRKAPPGPRTGRKRKR